MQTESGYNPFDVQPVANTPETPAAELRTIDNQTIAEATKVIDRQLELNQKPEGRVIRINLVCPEAKLDDIVATICAELRIESSPIIITIHGPEEQTTAVQNIYTKADVINASPTNRHLILVRGFENVASVGNTENRAVNWRLAHDFFQELADSNGFRQYVASLDENKQVFIVLTLTYDQSPQETEAKSETYRSFGISHFADHKITFL
ncbi:MAG: hypothetical protein BWY68_00619 [bacterium ADurb.Bin400]|nr:MAG: hypothetical protein BWY68_00619 [bacterium ADurb.Bin400]